MTDPNEHSNSDYWQVLLDEETKLRAVCRRIAGKAKEDEAFSEVCFRFPSIVRNYDPAKGASLRTHVYVCARWYVWKFANKRSREVNEEHDKAILHSGFDSIDNSEILQPISEKLTPFELKILMLRYGLGYTFQEIGNRIGCVTVTAQRYVREALERAREECLN